MSDDFESYEFDEEEQTVSRSEIKRQMLALQALGERLVGLKPAQWEGFGFSEVMLDALRESQRIKSHNAMRRHIRRLGKLLSQEDTEKVELLFKRTDDRAMQDTQRFHRIEQWRDRLIEGDDKTLSDLLDICPNVDVQHLRQLIRTGKKERELAKPPAAQRKLFKYLRELDID
ncbi:ribosome biogenesis factor YjgA [Sedimenticola hydrogenitrophicus]|uniref:ribosome biogenesis factor YjgA n=1 Tax=Sedimenticola hydrogenitrophicus TaxID=2967975 RepID=UPI0023B1957C|nr:ribosome biogenesis factor YjgA [Sedimenticola hydrogenitrophicus]